MEAFRAFDVDNNDSISAEELRIGLKRFCNLQATSREINMIMETMNDSNTKRSTEISLNSFIRWLTPTSKENEEKEKNDRKKIRKKTKQ